MSEYTMIAGNYLNQYYGKSTYTKPNDDYIPNGSTLYDMDTKQLYMWDKETKTWLEQ